MATAPATATGIHTTPKTQTVFSHPLDPLTGDEIAAVTLSIRQHVATKTEIKAVRFLTCYLVNPPKKAVLAYLGIPLTPGGKPEAPVPITRKAEVDFIDVLAGDAYVAIVTLNGAKWELESLEKLPEGTQPQISPEELLACEAVVRADPRVQALAREVGVEPHQIFADGWAIGYDERFPKKQRIQQALLFARFSQHDNLYAHPMDFIPVVDANTNKVIHIDLPPNYKSNKGTPELSVETTKFPPLENDPVVGANRGRIPPPLESQDFLPDLMNVKMRDDIKPLHVVQPEGVSFKMDGHVLEWQNWKMHIAFHHREGIALSTITYNDHGEIRPIFYRLSLVEMVVPYGAPEYPHPRKFAFDAGEYGMGVMANDLTLGCDCLGQIHYLPGAYVAHDGSAVVIKNVICIHEEDAGLLWKHTDYRVGGRSHSVRSRRLVVSMVCTLANYEYIWNYYFYQDGNIELEIRLSGILQVYVAKDDEPTPYGTLVAPRINAHYHQHIFSVRVDPMLDGLNNSVVEQDVIALPQEPGSDENFAGNGFTTKSTVLKNESEGARDFDFATDRKWKIVNPARQHYASKQDVGYAILMKGGAVPMLAKNNSWIGKRAGFTKKALWVVKDVEDDKGSRMWPSGKYVPGTRDTPNDSVEKWAEGTNNIENDDVVVFVTVGTTHIPRPEDWPVMPVDHLRVNFKPFSFFKANPGMDVPSGKDPRSVPAFANGALEGYTVQNGDACCHSN